MTLMSHQYFLCFICWNIIYTLIAGNKGASLVMWNVQIAKGTNISVKKCKNIRHEYSLKPGMPDHHISTYTHIFIHSSTSQRNFSINGPPTCMYLNSRRKMENLKETQISIGKPHIDCYSKSGLKLGPGAMRQQCLPLHCCATFLLLFSSCFIYTFLFFKV